jgi:hypothetical protein
MNAERKRSLGASYLTCDAPHLGGNQIDFSYGIDGKFRDAGVKRMTGKLQMTCVAMPICDIGI